MSEQTFGQGPAGSAFVVHTRPTAEGAAGSGRQTEHAAGPNSLLGVRLEPKAGQNEQGPRATAGECSTSPREPLRGTADGGSGPLAEHERTNKCSRGWGAGFKVWSSGFKVKNSELGRSCCFGGGGASFISEIWGVGFRVQDPWFQGLGWKTVRSQNEIVIAAVLCGKPPPFAGLF